MATWRTALTIGLALGGAGVLVATPRPSGAQDPAAARPAAPDAFARLYVLAEGEDVKLLGGEAARARLDHFRDKAAMIGLAGWPEEQVQGVPTTVLFRWRDGQPRWFATRTGAWARGMGGVDEPVPLRSLLGAVASLKRQDVEGEGPLLAAPIRADVLIRDGLPIEATLGALGAALKREFGLAVRLSIGEGDRPVIVARGRYRYQADPTGLALLVAENPGRIVIANPRGEASTEFSMVAQRATLDRMFADLAGLLGIRFLSEVGAGPDAPLSYQVEGYKPGDPVLEADRAVLLDHVARQTGLTFEEQSRKVRFLRVDRAE